MGKKMMSLHSIVCLFVCLDCPRNFPKYPRGSQRIQANPQMSLNMLMQSLLLITVFDYIIYVLCRVV